MQEMPYIVCHGSGNRFALIDAVRDAAALAGTDLAALSRNICSRAGGLDGLLLLVRSDADFGMRMFNPDGSEAEMCGNGIRCVARLARERYVAAPRFTLWSGGRPYRLSEEAPVFGRIPTFGVGIPIRTASPDFVWEGAGERFVGGCIPPLDDRLRFTYLNLGNPHLVACTDRTDRLTLERLGRRVTELRTIFPHGVNVSLFRECGPQRIFAATFERGAGITSSCGTAMTACSTAACLLGLCRWNEPIDVSNSGGRVRCLCRRDADGIRTTLTGNATFEADGVVRFSPDGAIAAVDAVPRTDETEAYAAFLAAIETLD